MSCIHFKFKSSLDYEKLTFDGLHISLSDLKEAIMKQKKIGSVNQYTLSVKDAQSKKEYTDDQEMIPRNTSVIISRVPLANPVKIPKTQRKDHTLSQPEPVSMTTISAPSSFPPLTSHRQLTASELQETADLASANASEEDKVKAMMTQSSKDFDPSRYVSVPPSKGGPKRHPPPPTYICHRCGKKGHWIQLCPTNGDPSFDNRNYKRSLGTPASQIISASANMPGVMLDRHGNLVMKKVDYQAYMDAQRKVKPEAPAKLDLPDELVCPICKKLVKDAVIIQCCSESFCYECIQEYLCENEFICPLCKAEDISPETLVPNKALRTAAKNFQLKESEHKSVSEARGYVPIVTSQPVALSSKNLPPISAESAPSSSTAAMATSGVSNGPTGGVPEVPLKGTPTKDKDTTKSEEKAEREAGDATDPPTVDAEEGEKPSSQPPPSIEKSSSPTPQLPRPKTRSEAILDRILSKKQTPPPTATPTSSSIVTATTNSSRPTVAPPTVIAAPPTAASLLGVASGLAPPTIAAASALLSGAAAAVTRGSGSLLGLPRGPTPSATLPGQGAVLTTSAILPPPPPVVITEPNQSQEESAKLERIAAELMLAAAVNTKKSASPPPLTAAEFYRQQKMLRLITKQTRKRTPSPYSGVSDYSRASTPESFRSPSNSSSLSRSHSPSGSSYSGSPSRSRSRSPIATHRSHRSKKHRSHRHKYEKVRHEKLREKGKERKSGHRHSSRKKRKRHLSPESEEQLSKSHHPDRKKHRDNITLSALVEDDLLSPASSLPSGALSPTEMELESQGTSSSSHRKHRHKKRSKAKRSRRRRRSDEEMDVDLMAGPGDFPADYPGDHNLEAADQDTMQPTESVIKDADSEGRVELAVENEGAGGEESKEDKVVTDSDALAMAEADGARSKSSASLVPYQDSSTTETEGREREEGEEPTQEAAADDDEGNVHGSKEQPSSMSSSVSLAEDREVNDAIEELEALMKEGVAPANDNGGDDDILKSDGDEASAKEGATGNVKSDNVAVDEGAPPTLSAAVDGEREGATSASVEGEEEEGEEIVEDSLMIALHVDEDAIDQDSAELLDAECPNKGKEDGEITDSDKGDDDGDDDKRDTGPLSSSSTDKAPPIFSPSSAHRSSRVSSSPSKLTSLKSPTNVSSVAAAIKRRGDEGAELSDGQDNDNDVDLRVLLNKNKHQLRVQPLPGVAKKHFASAVTVTSGYMSSSQPQFESSTPVDEEWSSDDDRDSAGSSSDESSSEAEKLRSLKKVSSSKHSSSKRHKRKQHSSSKSRREKEKKRKKAKVYSENKKKSRREKEREREKAKKQKKHKKSDKYSTKYAH